MCLFSRTLINFSVCLCSLFQGITAAKAFFFFFMCFHGSINESLPIFYFLCSSTIRYTTWLSSGLSARKASDRSSNSSADAEWAQSVPVEDLVYVRHLQYCI